MSAHEWPADDYAIGSYIQANIAAPYLAHLTIKPTDRVLDIGCGNGAFTRKILAKVPQGSLLAIDPSENMLKLAQKEMAHDANANIQQADVLTMKFDQEFDCIVSFWCLQWCAFAIETAFENIYHALKTNGKFLTLFPFGDDPYITSYYAIKASGAFSCLNHFKPPVDYQNFSHLEERLLALPFKDIKVERVHSEIILPSLDTFRKFVNGVAFFQEQIPDAEIQALNEALVNVYEQQCLEKYEGEYKFILTMYLVAGEK